MRAPSTSEASLIKAAQAGDRRALNELATTYLPVVYNIVGRALSGQPDVDDVVQDTMLRALRELPALRTPESFRAWLAAIAVRQVGTHRQRRRMATVRSAALNEAIGVPDADADFEGLTILRLGLSGQRRQAVLASRWLDPDDRTLLSLWWLETVDQLTRRDLSAALGLTVAHTGVRIQRMLEQLESARSLVTALEARPRCVGLSDVVAGWDDRPSPLWRKRIIRHVRSCAVCARTADGLVPAARLLVGLALVPVPLALTAAVVAKATLPAAAGGVSVKAGLFGQLAQTVGAQPVATIALAFAIFAGTTLAVATSGPASRSPSAAQPARATPAAATIAHGPVSLESVDRGGQFVAYAGDAGVLARVGAASPAQQRQRGTFLVVAGLADPRCVSLRVQDGRYLRHSSWRLRLSADDGTVLFRQDATFCPRPGSVAGSVALASFSYPGRYLRHVAGVLWVDPSDGTAVFRDQSSFHARPALAG